MLHDVRARNTYCCKSRPDDKYDKLDKCQASEIEWNSCYDQGNPYIF